MQKKLSYLALSFCLLTPFTSSFADPASPYGLNFSFSAKSESPRNLRGWRTSFIYAPPKWAWEHVSIFLDSSFGHWWVTNATQYSSLEIISIAPVLRYSFKEYYWVTPFIDLSIGPSYLTKTRLNDHDLGIHYAFQDQLGFGVAMGPRKNLTISASALHYSNGSLARMNAGLNIPFMVNVSYRF